MEYKNVFLEGTGFHLPSEVLTSAEIEDRLASCGERLGLVTGRLEKLTGIRERRIWPSGTRPSAVSIKAAIKALEAANVSKDDINLVIHAGVCRDALEPATACVVHEGLGLDPSCIAFDVSNACVGFLNALLIAANMIELGQINYALVVSGENSGPIYPDTIQALLADQSADALKNRLASLTLGSGAVAFVLASRKKAKTTHQLLGGAIQTDSRYYHVCEGQGNIFHQSMVTNTEEMLRQGLNLSKITWEIFKASLGWSNQTPDFVFSHQVSRSHNTKALETLGLSDKKSYFDFENLGNTGSVAVPLGLAMRVEQSLFKQGDKIALLGIGSGLSCVMLGVDW